MRSNITKTVHWIGFFISCFMLFASILDESKDEVFIHLTASGLPLFLAITIRYLITKEFKIMPFR
ncbi:hypothetical protein N9D48_05335 [Gammaproteobacteria bacterium]|nr:hypothetical protein [Gammaproteobacteria bacterium]